MYDRTRFHRLGIADSHSTIRSCCIADRVKVADLQEQLTSRAAVLAVRTLFPGSGIPTGQPPGKGNTESENFGPGDASCVRFPFGAVHRVCRHLGQLHASSLAGCCPPPKLHVLQAKGRCCASHGFAKFAPVFVRGQPRGSVAELHPADSKELRPWIGSGRISTARCALLSLSVGMANGLCAPVRIRDPTSANRI